MFRSATADEKWRIHFAGFEISQESESECDEVDYDGDRSDCATGCFPTANQGVCKIQRIRNVTDSQESEGMQRYEDKADRQP